MIEKESKQKCDPFQVFSLNLEKMLTNTYMYADIRKTVTFLISLGMLFSVEWSIDYVCSMRSSHFCLLLTEREMRGRAREREKVRDGVGLKIPAAELFFPRIHNPIYCA